MIPVKGLVSSGLWLYGAGGHEGCYTGASRASAATQRMAVMQAQAIVESSLTQSCCLKGTSTLAFRTLQLRTTGYKNEDVCLVFAY